MHEARLECFSYDNKNLDLAEALFKNGFDLSKSINIEANEALEYAKRLTL